MKLNFEQVGNGPGLIILHGLFGSASNFRTLARQIGEFYTVYSLDLRNHGASPHDSDVSFDAMAADIIEFMDDHNIQKTNLMGHSLGGKVAMQVALSHPDRISRLIAGDIAPVEYPHHHDGIFDGLNAVSRSDVSSRKEADAILADYVAIPEVRLFLLTNLVRKDDGSLGWRINVSGLEGGYEYIAKRPKGHPYPGPSLFIRGALSDYVREDNYPAIYALFPQARIVTMEGTGHWLHAEKPQEYKKIVLNFLGED
ncbi:MAG: alpha/beta fold hydrolase [Alphaproteobacteria bacterium]|nr:alpha/beta fold hydrolase [Alphaproteobacteria bacterium]